MIADVHRALRPSRFILIIGGLIWLAFQLIPADTYLQLFWSRKLSGNAFTILLPSVIVLVALFSAIGEQIGRRRNGLPSRAHMIQVDVPRWWILGGLIVSIIAYLFWFSLGIIRSGGPLNLYAAFRDNAFYVKEVLLAPVPGITSFTQTAVMAIPLAMLNQKSGQLEKILMGLVFLLAILRSFLYSERLAVLEIIIPFSIVWIIKNRVSLIRAFQIGITFIIMVIAFFIYNESNRSFAARGITDVSQIVMLGLYRFFGYYLTSVNNFGLAEHYYTFKFPFYFTFLGFWSLPGFEVLYTDILGLPRFEAPSLLSLNRLNPELNVFTTPGYWVMEYGLGGTLVMAATYGLLTGLFYSWSRKSYYWLAFYSLWFIGILEFMRIYYFGGPRIFIPIVYFLLTLVIANAYRSKGRITYEFSR